MCLYFPNALFFCLPFLKDCPQSENDFSTTLVCQISNRKYVRKSKIVSWIGAFSLKRAGNKFLEIPKKSTKFFSLGPTQNPLVVTPYGFDPHHRHKNKFPQLYPGWGTYFYFSVLRGRTARSRRSGTQISPVGCLRGRGRPPSPAPIVPKWFLPLRYFLFGRYLFSLSAKLSAIFA